MFQLTEWKRNLVNTLFEYITIILAAGLILTLVAYFRKRSENMELKRELFFLERKLERMKQQLESLATMKSNANIVEFEKGNLDLQILELYTKGYSYGMIAKKLGISKSTVYRRLKAMLNMKRKSKEPISLKV